jgi:hypothetical protein
MPVPLAGPAGFLPLHTLLVITPLSGAQGLELTPYAARGLSQTIKQIGDASNIRRTVIGNLVNAAPPWFKQYSTTIVCRDMNTPCLDDAFRGEIVEIQCAAELNYGAGGTAHRQQVSGSSRTEGTITFYRPILICMIKDIDPTFEEYEGYWSWRVEAEEVGLPAEQT